MKNNAAKKIIYERYKGSRPYIFLLFSESDRENVIPLINSLQAKSFRLWYSASDSRRSGTRNIYQQKIDGASLVLFYASSAARDDIHVKNDLLFCSGRKKPIVSFIADRGESNLVYGLPESVPEVSDAGDLIRAEGFSTDLIGEKPGRNVSNLIRTSVWLLIAVLALSGSAFGYYRWRVKKENDRQTLTVLSLDTLPDDPAELEQYPMLQKIVIPASQAGEAGPYLEKYTVVLRGDGE